MKPIDKTPTKEKESAESKDDLRPEWEEDDRQEQGRTPDLEEIEEDPSGFE
jgi:hypothetical protein